MSAKTVKKIKLETKKNTRKVSKSETTKSSSKSTEASKSARRNYNPITAFGRYVKGSWDEIRQVRWPNRRATWGMTLAVLLYTLFFSVIILVLDGLFQLLFKTLLLK